MKKIFLFIFLMLSACGFSQQIHSPAEILKIMENSSVSYNLNALKKTIDCKDFSDKLNDHDCYRVVRDSGLYTYPYTINDKARPLFEKGEIFFQFENLDSAMTYYKLALNADSSVYKIMTYIGQIYEKRKDYDNAIEWYRKTIGKNYIDYMAHWFLSDNYLEKDDVGDAVDEIVISQILNRNNPRIKFSMDRIFKQAKRNTDDWCFNPQIELTKNSDNKVLVAFNEKWVGYALAKALWTYEPGYKASMGVAPGEYSMIEDKECLISLLAGLESAKINIKKDPQLKILKEAAEKDLLNEYILYEIVLPQYPAVAYQLTEKTILSIKDYILTVRNKK